MSEPTPTLETTAKNPGGRPEKLTELCQKRIVQAIQIGAPFYQAARYGGVSYRAFQAWMARGENESRGKYRTFYLAVKAAEANAVVGWLVKIEAAANAGNWTAAAWKLERKYPELFGKRQVEITGAGGAPLAIEHHHTHELKHNPDQVAQILAVMQQAGILKLAAQEINVTETTEPTADPVTAELEPAHT